MAASLASTELVSRPSTPEAPPPQAPLPLPPIRGSSDIYRPHTSNSQRPPPRRIVPQRSFHNASTPPISRSAGEAQRMGHLPPPAILGAYAPVSPDFDSPEDIMRTIRDRSRDSYHATLHRPSVPNLKSTSRGYKYSDSVKSRSNSITSAPGQAGPYITAISAKGSLSSSAATAPIVPTGFRKDSTTTNASAFGFGAAGASEIGCFSGGSRSRSGSLGGYTVFNNGDGSSMASQPRWEDSECLSRVRFSGGGRGLSGVAGDGASSNGRGTPLPHGHSAVKSIKNKMRNMFKGFHVSVQVGFRERPDSWYKGPRMSTEREYGEITLRVKNSADGNCVFEMFVPHLIITRGTCIPLSDEQFLILPLLLVFDMTTPTTLASRYIRSTTSANSSLTTSISHVPCRNGIGITRTHHPIG